MDAFTAFPEMSAVVSVVNTSGVPIRDLTREDFEVIEDGQPLTPTALEAETNPDQPIAVALVLDLSGSAPLEAVQEAAHQFLDYLGPNDMVALVGFNAPLDFDTFDPFKESDFTYDKELIRSVVDGLTVTGKSAVYEGIYKGLLITSQQKLARRAVIVMSDGHDTASREEIATADTVKTAARQKNIPIFTVGIYHEDPEYGRNPDYLKVLASESGGRYQEASDPSQLGELFQNAVDQLRLQYRLGWSSGGQQDGNQHVLTLRVTTADGQAQAERTVGYAAVPPSPGPSEAAEAESPAPVAAPPPPQVSSVQRDDEGTLGDLGTDLKGNVLLVPQIDSQNPIAKVEYLLDGELLHTAQTGDLEGQATHKPWEWTWETGQEDPGDHQLTITAYDDSGRASSPYTVQVQIMQGGIDIPYVGEVDWIGVIVVVAGALLLLFAIVLLIVVRHRPAPVPVGGVGAVEMGAPRSPYVPPGETAPGVPGAVGMPTTMDVSGSPQEPDTKPSVSADAGAATSLPSAVSPAPFVGGPTELAGVGRPTPWAQPGPPAGDLKTELLGTQADQVSALAWLIARTGAWAGQEFRLAEVTDIGRTGGNDIILDDASVSRQHAKIKLEDEGYYLYDLGATNPTMVNDQEVTRHQLTDGDRISIGQITLVFKQVEGD